MRGIGTVINIITVMIGGSVGSLIGLRFSEKIRATLLNAIGIFTMVIGFSYASETKNVLIPLFSILLGGILGEVIDIEKGLENFAEKVKKTIKTSDGRFSEGFVAASLLFCVGPMSILGSLNDGLKGEYQILAVKAVLDGFAGMALSATLGWGVVLSVITILLYQGSLTILGFFLGNIFTNPMITEMTATGGILIVGIGLMLLELKRIRLANLLPSIFIAPLIVFILRYLGVRY